MTERKLILAVVVYLSFQFAEANLADVLADRAVFKWSTWINDRGSFWVKLPGHFREGIIPNGNGRFSLAIASPEFDSVGSIQRLGEAELDDGHISISGEFIKTLSFTLILTNLTLRYTEILYVADDAGYYNTTCRATLDEIVASVMLDVKGAGDSCQTTTDAVTVTRLGRVTADVELPVTAEGLTDVLVSHVVTYTPDAVRTLLKTAAFNTLYAYDLCSDVYYPYMPPNLQADHVIGSIMNGLYLKMHASSWDWAVLPAFSKTSVVNDTNLDVVEVSKGNFTSFGMISRVGAARYINQLNPKYMNMEMSLEVTNLTAMYGYIEYKDYEGWYGFPETVTAHKIIANVTVTFVRAEPFAVPSCLSGSVTVRTAFDETFGLNFDDSSSNAPEWVNRAVNEVLGPGFVESVGDATADLLFHATIRGLEVACDDVIAS